MTKKKQAKKKATKKVAAKTKTKATAKKATKKTTTKKKAATQKAASHTAKKKATKKATAKKTKSTSKSKPQKATAIKTFNLLEEEPVMLTLSSPDQPIDYDIIEAKSHRELVEKVRGMLYVLPDGSAWIPQGGAFEEDDHWYQTMVKFD